MKVIIEIEVNEEGKKEKVKDTINDFNDLMRQFMDAKKILDMTMQMNIYPLLTPVSNTIDVMKQAITERLIQLLAVNQDELDKIRIKVE